MLFKLALPLILAAGVGGPLAVKHGAPACHAMAARALGITEAQQAAFHLLHEKHKPALTAKAAAFFQARSALLDAALDPASTTDGLRPLHQKTADAGFGLAREVRAVYLEILPQLTDAQRAKARAGLDMLRSHVESHGQGHHQLVQGLLGDRLELTEAQRQALDAIHEARRPALQEKREALHGAIFAALDTALDPAATEAALEQSQQQVATAAFAMGAEARGAYLEALPVLTDAQRAKGRELLAQFRTHAEGLRKVLMGF